MGSKRRRTLGICCFAGLLVLGSLLQGSMSPAAAQYVLGRAGQKILIPPPPPPPRDVQDEAEQKPGDAQPPQDVQGEAEHKPGTPPPQQDEDVLRQATERKRTPPPPGRYILGKAGQKIVIPLPYEPRLRSFVVLLAKEDGSVGEVEITVDGQTAVLSDANRAVNFDQLDDTFEVSDQELRTAVPGLLEAETRAPEQFLVYFGINKTTLTAASRRSWSSILESITGRNAPEVTVSGHTDRSGSSDHNEQLSRSRAEAIRTKLVAETDLEPSQVEIRAFGERRPAVPTSDDVQELRNRRVVIRVR